MVCLSSMPATMLAETEEMQNSQIEMEQNQISIAVSGSTKAFELGQMQRGFYIVKIGKFTRKIYLH